MDFESSAFKRGDKINMGIQTWKGKDEGAEQRRWRRERDRWKEGESERGSKENKRQMKRVNMNAILQRNVCGNFFYKKVKTQNRRGKTKTMSGKQEQAKKEYRVCVVFSSISCLSLINSCCRSVQPQTPPCS